MKDTLTVLREARALIADPDRWGKFYFGGDNGPWCAEGACFASAFESTAIAAISLLDDATASWDCAMAFNDADSTTHADILALFDRAIAAEEAKAVTRADSTPVPQATPRRRDNAGCETRDRVAA